MSVPEDRPASIVLDPVIRLDPRLAVFVSLGVVAIDGTEVRKDDPRLDEPLAAAARAACASGNEVAAVRAMYKQLGIDPTKTRPSSEALLRRIRKGGQLPRINTVVDIANWCSLELQWPYGLYDLDRVSGPIELRIGRAGEEYQGIRKDVVHVAGRPALVDAIGPFGNPTSDSARTMVTTETCCVLVTIYAPRSTETPRLTAALDLTASRMHAYAGGRERCRAIL